MSGIVLPVVPEFGATIVTEERPPAAVETPASATDEASASVHFASNPSTVLQADSSRFFSRQGYI
jgi:hypothetical protein